MDESRKSYDWINTTMEGRSSEGGAECVCVCGGGESGSVGGPPLQFTTSGTNQELVDAAMVRLWAKLLHHPPWEES